MNWYLKVVKEHYADFKGRARRREYWMFTLFNLIIMVVLTVIGILLRFPFIQTIYGLAVLVPALAVCVRRLHDLGKSGWLLLLQPDSPCQPLSDLSLLLGGREEEQCLGPEPKASSDTAC